jgi:predicted DNA-binding WGR domain protein
MTRNFICTKGNADKFWTIKVSGKSITTIYGKNNSYAEPKSTKNSFETAELCEKESGKLVAAKLKEGYEEVTLNFPDVPVYVLKKVQEAIENKVTELEVDISGSTELLKEICSMINLKKLELKNVKILPEDISKLKDLERFEIEDSKGLKSIPKEIGQFIKLRYLQIEDTSIESLPDEIGNLSGLKNLRISGNTRLQSLPETIGKLTNLEKTYIQGNSQNGELWIYRSSQRSRVTSSNQKG